MRPAWASQAWPASLLVGEPASASQLDWLDRNLVQAEGVDRLGVEDAEVERQDDELARLAESPFGGPVLGCETLDGA